MQQNQTASLALATKYEPRSTPSESQSRNTLLRKWLAALALNAGQALDTDAIGVTVTLWTEGFADLSDSVLEAAFRKMLKTAKYWPIKVSDVREHVSRAVENETDRTAEEAWKAVLDIRRRLWNPDIPAPFDRAMSMLTERVKYAARASGVFRDFTASEWESGALHTWGKKRFVESFQSWGDSKQDEYLLPEGEVKKLLIECADAMKPEKRLPAPKQETPEERLRIADELAKAAREVIATYKPKECIVAVSDETRLAVRQQAELIRRKYPDSKTPPHLQQYILGSERPEDSAQ